MTREAMAVQLSAAGLLPPGAGSSVSVTQLDPVPLAAGLARQFVAANLARSSSTQREAALLLASELVTNVLLHARTSLEVGVCSRAGDVVLAVTDHDPGEGSAGARKLRGRSKDLVEALADDHGSLNEPRCQTVWVLLREHGRAMSAGTLDLTTARR